MLLSYKVRRARLFAGAFNGCYPNTLSLPAGISADEARRVTAEMSTLAEGETFGLFEDRGADGWRSLGWYCNGKPV